MGLGPCGKRFVGIRRVLVVLAACAAAAGAQAAGSIASLALDSLSTSVGVSSQSISGVVSSGSSGRDKVAQGPYRIQALVRQPDADGDERRWVWVGLDPVGEAAPWTLRLPAPVAGVVYVVSALVADRARRSDVVSPDTGPSAIRDGGQIVAVTGFTVWA